MWRELDAEPLAIDDALPPPDEDDVVRELAAEPPVDDVLPPAGRGRLVRELAAEPPVDDVLPPPDDDGDAIDLLADPTPDEPASAEDVDEPRRTRGAAVDEAAAEDAPAARTWSTRARASSSCSRPRATRARFAATGARRCGSSRGGIAPVTWQRRPRSTERLDRRTERQRGMLHAEPEPVERPPERAQPRQLEQGRTCNGSGTTRSPRP